MAACGAAADVGAQRAAISGAFIEDLCAIGTPQDVAAGVARYRAAGATNPMITNITGTDLRPTLRAALSAEAPCRAIEPGSGAQDPVPFAAKFRRRRPPVPRPRRDP